MAVREKKAYRIISSTRSDCDFLTLDKICHKNSSILAGQNGSKGIERLSNDFKDP